MYMSSLDKIAVKMETGISNIAVYLTAILKSLWSLSLSVLILVKAVKRMLNGNIIMLRDEARVVATLKFPISVVEA